MNAVPLPTPAACNTRVGAALSTSRRLWCWLLFLPLVSCQDSAAPVKHEDLQEEKVASLATPSPIILISLDTLRADMLTPYGYEKYPTSPFLDSFAGESILFENCIVQEPRTLTSHMCLFTGLYPQNHGVKPDVALHEDIPTLASLLKESGYRTKAFVDGGWLTRTWGFSRGFDHYQNQEKAGFEKTIPEAKDWLKQQPDGDYFLFLHTYDIHSKGAGR